MRDLGYARRARERACVEVPAQRTVRIIGVAGRVGAGGRMSHRERSLLQSPLLTKGGMMRATRYFLCAALVLAPPLALAGERSSGDALDAAKPTQGRGKTHDTGAEQKGAQELPSGAQTGGMRTGIPEGAGKGGKDPNANKPSTTGPDEPARPDNRRGAGTQDSRTPASR